MKLRSHSLKEIAAALVKSSFFAEIELASADIDVQVKELGEIKFPIKKRNLQQLIRISSKAKFGLGEKTLHDEKVRDCHEIKSDQLKVTIKAESLKNMMVKIGEALGLAQDIELLPFLYNMLIYGPGQFFLKHKDNEKLENMVVTLVIVLPSPHIGGTLVVEHSKQKHAFVSENIEASFPKCFAFYADCEHEIEKIREGYRVALTYNVVLKMADQGACPTKILEPKLHSAVKKYFGKVCEKLAYLLEHSYSKHGLKWNLLKGADRTNGSALLATADKLGLVPRLALLKIEVKMLVYDEDATECEFDKATAKISHCIDTDNKSVQFDFDISDYELCWTKNCELFTPYKVEEEGGYYGNEGGSKDLWYERAGIILFSKGCKAPNAAAKKGKVYKGK